MFDEAQHVSDRGQYITQYKVRDWLKSLIDKLMVPTVFVGLPTLELLLQVNEQLRRRFSKRLSLAFGQGGSKNLNVECFQIFQTLSNVLPIPITFSPYLAGIRRASLLCQRWTGIRFQGVIEDGVGIGLGGKGVTDQP